MTIFEKINQMNVEDMAKFLFWIKNTRCNIDFCQKGKSGQCICSEDENICLSGLQQWLESKVENE